MYPPDKAAIIEDVLVAIVQHLAQADESFASRVDDVFARRLATVGPGEEVLRGELEALRKAFVPGR